MNREILFRGYSPVIKGWVYGGFVSGENSWIVTIRDDGKFEHCMVDPATVGQFTGLCDNNGVRIFEGDVVSVDGKNHEVKYMLGQFFVGINMPVAYVRFRCEVIGNIQDHPSLVQG